MAEGGALDCCSFPWMRKATRASSISGAARARRAVLASLLNAASGVGPAAAVGRPGDRLRRSVGRFPHRPASVTVARASAIGAGLGLSADGTFDTERYLIDNAGVSAFYLVNGSLDPDPPGEGVVGVNFTLRGNPEDPAGRG
jgi:hypothetical protein